MPCDSVILNQVDLKLADKDLLLEAIAQLADKGTVHEYNSGISFRYKFQQMTVANGVLTCRQGMESTADLIKQAYSGVVVEKAASRFGWALEKKEQNQFVISRRV